MDVDVVLVGVVVAVASVSAFKSVEEDLLLGAGSYVHIVLLFN